jgi:hypothetical protein
MFHKAFAPLLLLLYAPLSASFSVQLPGTVEFDLVFPREGGSYTVTDPFPVIIAVQNAVVAFDYGFDFTWSISPIGALNDNPTPLAFKPFNYLLKYLILIIKKLNYLSLIIKSVLNNFKSFIKF